MLKSVTKKQPFHFNTSSRKNNLKFLTMKKFALKTMALVLFVSTALTSCSNDDDSKSNNQTTQKEFTTAVTGPTTGAKNQEITLTVTHVVDNNCGVFNRFVESTSGNTKTVEVEVKYTGTNCGTTPSTKTQPYKFTVSQNGTYVFKFKKSATEFITHSVVIQ
jgi:hypothetical protein